MILPIIIFLGLFGTIFGIAYVFLSTRNKERLALIQSGTDASLFEMKGTKFSIAKFILNIALLLIGIGIGFLMGAMLDEFTPLGNDVAYFSMLFIFGGLGLMTGYFVTRRIEKKDSE